MIRVTLEGPPPLINRSYKVGNGGFYKDSEQKVRQEAYQWQAKAQYRLKPLRGPLSVVYEFYYSRANTDWESGVKGTQDALNGILWMDDVQIIEATVRKFHDSKKPRVEIIVSE
jgi:Holliday junction resolvase RusA-like endonuclease